MNWYLRAQSHRPVYGILLVYNSEITSYLAETHQWEIDFWSPPDVQPTACY